MTTRARLLSIRPHCGATGETICGAHILRIIEDRSGTIRSVEVDRDDSVRLLEWLFMMGAAVTYRVSDSNGTARVGDPVAIVWTSP